MVGLIPKIHTRPSCIVLLACFVVALQRMYNDDIPGLEVLKVFAVIEVSGGVLVGMADLIH